MLYQDIGMGYEQVTHSFMSTLTVNYDALLLVSWEAQAAMPNAGSSQFWVSKLHTRWCSRSSKNKFITTCGWTILMVVEFKIKKMNENYKPTSKNLLHLFRWRRQRSCIKLCMGRPEPTSQILFGCLRKQQ
jgi:hypothetical protein